jgi:hypothetical protein
MDEFQKAKAQAVASQPGQTTKGDGLPYGTEMPVNARKGTD